MIKTLKEEILKSEDRWRKQAKKPYTMSNKTIVDYLRQLLDRDLSEYEEAMINPPPELQMIKKVKTINCGEQTWLSDTRYKINYIYSKSKHAEPPKDIGIQNGNEKKDQ